MLRYEDYVDQKYKEHLKNQGKVDSVCTSVTLLTTCRGPLWFGSLWLYSIIVLKCFFPPTVLIAASSTSHVGYLAAKKLMWNGAPAIRLAFSC